MSRPARKLQDLGSGVHAVPLTRGKVALIDSAFAEEIGRYDWQAQCRRGKWYAKRAERREVRFIVIMMHNAIMPPPNGFEVDHKNRDGLDNRTENLRHATRSQNMANRGLFRNNRSGFRGVYFNKRYVTKPWSAQIRVNHKLVDLGRFATAEGAAEAYREAAAKFRGAFVGGT